MFYLRPITCPDLCDRVGCQREPDVVLDQHARLAGVFQKRTVRLCMVCLAEAETKLTEREHRRSVRRYERTFGAEAAKMRGVEW